MYEAIVCTTFVDLHEEMENNKTAMTRTSFFKPGNMKRLPFPCPNRLARICQISNNSTAEICNREFQSCPQSTQMKVDFLKWNGMRIQTFTCWHLNHENVFIVFGWPKKSTRKPVTFISQNKTVITKPVFCFIFWPLGFGSRPSLTPVILELKKPDMQKLKWKLVALQCLLPSPFSLVVGRGFSKFVSS